MASNGYARISGGVKLEDINPNVVKDNKYSFYMQEGDVSIPISKYKKIRVKSWSGSFTHRYAFVYDDGTEGNIVEQAISDSTYTEITIPDGAMCYRVYTNRPYPTYQYIAYGLIV